MTSRAPSEFSALSTERPPEWEEPGAPPDWIALFRHLVHPGKVTVVETLDQARQPLSATEIWLRRGKMSPTSEALSHHVGSLAKLGVLEPTGQRRVRGAIETFYYFTPAFLQLVKAGGGASMPPSRN